MKTLTLGLGLFLISNLAIAEKFQEKQDNMVIIEQEKNNLDNHNFFKSHQIFITKEEKSSFLFFPYKKEVPVFNISLTGVENKIFSGYETSYISSATKKENEKTTINTSSIKNGINLEIKKQSDNTQTLLFNKTDLLRINQIKTQDNMVVEAPVTESKFLSLPINSEFFEQTWKSQDGTVYHLRYNGQKI